MDSSPEAARVTTSGSRGPSRGSTRGNYAASFSDSSLVHQARLAALGIRIFQLSDTIGVSEPTSISYLFSSLIPRYPQLEIGAHLHTTPGTWREKVSAAAGAGCRRFDGAVRGFGGCPMARDELTGNMPTERLLEYFGFARTRVREEAFKRALVGSAAVFGAA